MRSFIAATQAEMDEMEMTSHELAAAVLCGFDVIVKVD